MQKRLLAILLSVTSVLYICACSAKGEEIATGSFDIDQNTVLHEGYHNFTDRLEGV